MEYLGDYIDGAWRKVEHGEGVFTRENPGKLDEVAFEFAWTTSHVDDAVQAARRAQRDWDKLGLPARLKHVERLGEAFANRKEDIARAICEEVGKPMWEARIEAGALVGKIKIMSTKGLEHTRDITLADGSGRARYRPLGVLAVLGPFNFPVHLPNGHIIPALLTGNTLVIKPSEWTGGCMQIYFECVQEAGFPPGVLNLVQGPGPVGAALSGHEHVSGVLFTGSYETGLRIKRATLEHHWKLLALEMGGKNTSIVLQDADLEQTAHELILASFLTCGQRCTATSRIIAHHSVVDELLDRFKALSERVTTGDPATEDVFMGPLINQRAYDRFLGFQQDDEGGELACVLAGGKAREDLNGYYVQPAIWRANALHAHGSHQSQEIFGPDVIVYAAADEQELVHMANATDYGLAMSVFSSDRERFERLSYDLDSGIVNFNRTTAGASSALPFGGVKMSGNHRPAAITAGLYCTYPQSQLFQDAGFSSDVLSSGPLSKLR